MLGLTGEHGASGRAERARGGGGGGHAGNWWGAWLGPESRWESLYTVGEQGAELREGRS